MKIFFQVIVPALLLLFVAVPAHAQLAVLQADINLGTSDSPGIGSGFNTIGTNGSISYASGYSGPASGTPGRILINGTVGRRTLISCETSKTMTNTTGTNGATNLTATPFYVVLGTSNASSTGISCNGGTNVIDTNLPAAAADRTVLVGMRMDVTNVMNGGVYKLSNNGAGKLVVTIRQQGGGPPVSINISVDASAVFHKDVSISSTTNMDFGNISYTGTPASGHTASMGTNGNISYAGSFSGNATGTAGRIGLTGVNNGTTLEIYCSQTAVLSNGAGSTITLNGIEAASETGRAAFGGGLTCNGIAGAAAGTFSFTSGTRDEVYIGGRLDGATATGSFGGNYSTANGGGTPISVIVVIP